ncbi:MAG: ATP-binding protein [Pseudomonadota bacterium]
MKNINLRIKILLGAALLVTILGTAVIIFVHTTLLKYYKIELLEKCEFITTHASEMVVNPILTENRVKLKMDIIDIKESDPEIEYIFIKNEKDKIISHTFTDGFPADLGNIQFDKEKKSPYSQEILANNERALHIIALISDGNLGQIHIGFSQENIYKNIFYLTTTLILIVALIFILGIIAAFFFSSAITNPLRELLISVKKTGQGKFDHMIKIRSKDEIGELAGAFNSMVTHIKDTQDTLERSNLAGDLINQILLISIDTLSLKETLQKILEKIINTHWFSVEEKGAIFLLKPNENKLKMIAQSNLNNALLTVCKEVDFGTCLCGRAAKSRELVYRSNLDSSHDITYDGIVNHGHYCMPIKIEDDVLGVLNLYLKEGHEYNKREVDLLNALSNVLAITIKKKLADDKIKETQSKLLQSEKLAAIGQLASGVAHEINNPLAFVKNNISILKEHTQSIFKIMLKYNELKDSFENKHKIEIDKIQEEIIKHYHKIDFKDILVDLDDMINESMEGVERISKIIKELNTFSRKDENIMSEANINDILESVLKICWNEIKYKAELKKDYGNFPNINCNPQQLGQVFLNLLVNASQSITDKGTINIKTWANNKNVMILIKDTGSGIKKENIDKIFEPFFTTKETGKGTGLGMSISFEIIKKHGGEIIVESQEGQGTSFTITLPL